MITALGSLVVDTAFVSTTLANTPVSQITVSSSSFDRVCYETGLSIQVKYRITHRTAKVDTSIYQSSDFVNYRIPVSVSSGIQRRQLSGYSRRMLQP